MATTVDTPHEAGSLVGTGFEVEVGAVAHGGHCVARHDGRVVFVRHALPGERVKVIVTRGRDTDRFLLGDAVEILLASPDRVPAPCLYAGPGRCGGCDFQHVGLPAQRVLKAAVVREQLQRLAGIDRPVTVEPVPGDEDGLRWRTRVEFAVDAAGDAGLRRHHSHQVEPLEDCVIAARPVIDSGVLQRPWVGYSAVDVVSPSAGEGVVTVPIPADGTPPHVPDVLERVSVGPWSAPFRVSARGFWQVHPGAAALFVEHVLGELAPRSGEHALDLYAGVGLFARALAEAVGRRGSVVAVESDARAVRDATRNLRDRRQVQVHRARVDRALQPLVRQQRHVDLVVLDPPRSGAGKAVVRDIAALTPRVVAYVACDPAALARDLGYAKDAGYQLSTLRAFDAFPMTHHVECIAVLVPAGPQPAQ